MITTNLQNTKVSKLEQYFKQFRDNIVGIDLEFKSPFGTKKIVYTDWTASGRLYRPIEEKILKAEEEVERIENIFSSVDFYEKHADKTNELNIELASAKEHVTNLYNRWEELESMNNL
ncbi:MAG: ABC transporter C-terminal domain-containing protein [Bacteroidota bacterium]